MHPSITQPLTLTHTLAHMLPLSPVCLSVCRSVGLFICYSVIHSNLLTHTLLLSLTCSCCHLLSHSHIYCSLIISSPSREHSLTYYSLSFTHSLPPLNTHSLTSSLPWTLTHSLPWTLTHSLPWTLTHSLPPLNTHSLTHSLPWTLTHSLTYYSLSFTHIIFSLTHTYWHTLFTHAYTHVHTLSFPLSPSLSPSPTVVSSPTRALEYCTRGGSVEGSSTAVERCSGSLRETRERSILESSGTDSCMVMERWSELMCTSCCC